MVPRRPAERSPTTRKGEAEVRLPALSAGAWRLRYETRDAFGGKYETTKDFVVAGKGVRIAFPEVLLAERESVGSGGVARFLVASGLPGQVLYFDVLRGGKVVSRRAIASAQSGVIEIPVSAEDRGGFAVRVSLVRDHQFLTEGRSVLVPWSDKELRVSFATFRDRLRPGAKETWRVTVKAPPGTPAEASAAELLAYMYDRSLDFFVAPSPPDPLSLYPNRSADSGLFTSIQPTGWSWVFGRVASRQSWVPLRGDRLKFFEGYGVGGPGRRMAGVGIMAKAQASVVDAAAPATEALAVKGGEGGPTAEVTVSGEPALSGGPPASQPSELRSNFSETAFWMPHLLTDAEGSAVIEFVVPDSVTSWSVWVHAITRDLAAGSAHREAKSVKELMVRPYVPRFLREGDTADLEVVVNNASDRPLSGSVTLDVLDTETNASALAAFGLTPQTATRAFTAAAGGSANAAFALSAPRRVGTYAIKATAAAGDFSDGELRPGPCAAGPHAAVPVPVCGPHGRRTAHAELPGDGQDRRPEPDRRAARRHRGRAALLLGLERPAVSRQLPVRVHRADAQPLSLDRDRVLAVSRLPGGRGDGRGHVAARDAARELGGAGPHAEDGARGDPVARGCRGAARTPGPASSTSSTPESRRPNAKRRSRSCATPRRRRAPSRGGRGGRRRPT